jgi:hypothetical protein
MKQFKANRWLGLTLLLAIIAGKFFEFRQSIVAYKVNPETGEWPVPKNVEINLPKIEKQIKDSIEDKVVLLYSWSGCPFSKKARSYLKS